MIEVENLTFAYDSGPRVFDGLSVSIEAGQTVAVLGANGTGKTTFLRLLAGLLEPTAGTIRIDGHADPVVGLAPETPADGLFAATVAAELRFFPANRDLDVDDHVQRAIEQFDLGDLADRNPHTLSEGEQRLVTVAAVFSGDPDVVGLDEPTSGLDARGRQRLGARLDALDRTVVVVTHDTNFAWRHADTVVVLDEDGLYRQGPTRSVLAAPDFDPDAAGLRLPEPVAWARRHDVAHPPVSVQEAVALLAERENR